MNINDKVLPSLEIECDQCDGECGYHSSYEGKWIYCSKCKGSGYVPTALGAQILELMRHNFESMLQDVNGE